MKRKTFIIVSIVVALVASGAFAATAIHAGQPDGEIAAETADATAADTAEAAPPKIRPVNVRTWEVSASDLQVLANKYFREDHYLKLILYPEDQQ